jgi:cytochrome b6-f complex iron-sulfur subunit/menaquinol-cytochrome c reductase iron-sulfur subunit
MATTDRDRRRNLLKVVLASGVAALGVATVAPAVAFVLPKHRTGSGGRWVRTVRLDALGEGIPHKVKIVTEERDAWKLERNAELGAVWLVRNGDAVRALAVVCPHLGCSIGASDDGSGFVCPCHDSSFDAGGKRRDGPSPRDMDVLETRIANDYVEVDFRRYRQGTPDRVEIG